MNISKCVPGVPKKATSSFENNKKEDELPDKFGHTIFESLIPQLRFWYILQSKIGSKL